MTLKSLVSLKWSRGYRGLKFNKMRLLKQLAIKSSRLLSLSAHRPHSKLNQLSQQMCHQDRMLKVKLENPVYLRNRDPRNSLHPHRRSHLKSRGSLLLYPPGLRLERACIHATWKIACLIRSLVNLRSLSSNLSIGRLLTLLLALSRGWTRIILSLYSYRPVPKPQLSYHQRS